MLRSLSQRALKAAPRTGLRLSTSRLVHSMMVPFTGPPSYDTVAQRFSLSQPDPQAYFNRKRAQEATPYSLSYDRQGNPKYPKDKNLSIGDIEHGTLETTIAEEIGIPYLSKATEADGNDIVLVGTGYIHGERRHTIVPFIVKHQSESRWVFFVVDNGSVVTYLSNQTFKVLGADEMQMANVTIGGHCHTVYQSPEGSSIRGINILGTGFCHENGIQKWEDYSKKRAKLFFGGMVEMPKS